MRLAKRLKKTMGLMLISTMVLSAAPVMAADYDNHWAKEAITKWSDYGVVAGYGDGVFKPNAQVTRAELAIFISRVFGLEATEGATSFADVAADAWYAQDVAKVSAAGIMQGAEGKFSPNGFATRQEVAVTLVNAFRLTGSGELNFKDQDEIAAWAKEAVTALATNGYAKGQADNKFAPKSNITRAEVVQLLDNIVEQLVHKSGTYTNDVVGNVVINTTDAILEGIKVSGNVYLAQGIGLGDATLKNTEVAGDVLVAGGGVNSIHFEKATVAGHVVVNTKKAVRLVSKDSSLKVTAAAKQSIVLTGSFKEVVVPADVVLELKGATVEKMVVVPSGNAVANITIDKESLVKELTAQAATQIKGNGKITLLKVEANGVTSTIRPGKVEAKPGCDISGISSSNSGSGGGGTTGGTGDSGNNDGTEKPEVEYVAVSKITLEGKEVPTTAVNINKNVITVDARALQAFAEKEKLESITTGSVVFGNLKKDDKISIQLVGSSTKVQATVEENGEVSYDVSELREVLNAKRNAIVDRLVSLEIDGIVEDILLGLGLSLEDNYLNDGDINVETLVAKMEQTLTLLEQKQNETGIKLILNVLKEYGITVDTAAKKVSGKVTVQAGQLKATEYTFTIQY